MIKKSFFSAVKRRDARKNKIQVNFTENSASPKNAVASLDRSLSYLMCGEKICGRDKFTEGMATFMGLKKMCFCLLSASMAFAAIPRINSLLSLSGDVARVCGDDLDNSAGSYIMESSDELNCARRQNDPERTQQEGYRRAAVAEHSVSSEGGRSFSWYCAHRKDGKQPECDPEMRFIEDYGGFYIDRSHSDSDADDKVIYLTFDAGYENGNVAKILDVLKEENVPGAFFILENIITHDTDLVKRMAEEGHTVCNHTAKHRDMSTVKDAAEFSEEMQRLEKVYNEYTGLEMAKYYRPPEGRFSENSIRFAEEAGYNTIMWSFAYADWDNNGQMSPESAKKKILEGTHNGMVILLHPTSATNASIMKDLITEWKNMGYRFGTMEELVRSGEKS